MDELDLENLDEETKMKVVEALKKIIKDMTKLSAEKLIPKEEEMPMEGMEVEIEAKPLGEGASKVKDMMGMAECDDMEDEELQLPRWKKRQKQEA